MIAVVQIERWNQKSLLQRMRLWFRRYALEQTEAQSPWGSFQILHVCDKRVRWDQLESFSAASGARILLPEDLPSPERFSSFSPVDDEELFRSAAGRLLAQLRGPMAGRQVILADQKGDRLDWLKDWLFYGASFQALCTEEGRCKDLAQELLAEYGVVLLHNSRMCLKSGILLDPKGWLQPWKGFHGIVLTGRRIAGKGICLEPSADALEGWEPPMGISPQAFAAAGLEEGWLSPRAIPCQGWQNGVDIPWKKLLQLAEENGLNQ
ncbi:MAG: hypothetical protein PHE47_09125 [Oscillospiraceae bacterium]|nr:hypothetical protein [Oscillospiraceae bacterium]